MSRHDFGSAWYNWSNDFGGLSDDVFARTPREPRERPERPTRPDRPDRPDRPGNGGGDNTPDNPSPPVSSKTYISGDASVNDANEYNVQINFEGSWSSDLRQAFISAAEAISDFILGDVPDAGSRRNLVDDIVINAKMMSIDGAGGILGQAGPDALRAGSYLPTRGTMEFDVADANSYQSAGLFDDIVLHEMLHTIGFGTIWQNLGLVTGGRFNGAYANAEYPGPVLIPLESEGGAGTAYAHWSEDVFTNELMTGYIDGDNTLSYLTIASLHDLGYQTVSGANYSPPSFV